MYRGSSAVTGAVVGNVVTVTGLLTLYPSAATSHTPSLELTQPAVTVTSTGNALPTPIALSSLTPGGGIYQLKPYEGMLVRFPSVTSVSGTTGNLTETTETTTSTGQFFCDGDGRGAAVPRPGHGLPRLSGGDLPDADELHGDGDERGGGAAGEPRAV